MTTQTEPPPPAADTAQSPAKPWWKRWWGIALIVVLLLAVLSALTDGDEADDTDLAADEAEETVEETLDEEPEPEPAPEPEDEPEPEPEPEPFDPVELSGSGDDIVSLDTFDELVVVTFTHEGSGNFAVFLVDDAGEQYELLVNDIGAYTGTLPLNFDDDPAEFEITANGPWTATITAFDDQPTLADTPSGSGDQVLRTDGDSGPLRLTHDGSSNFAVFSIGPFGRSDLLVNEIGTYEGTVRLGQDLGLEITADGTWTAELQ